MCGHVPLGDVAAEHSDMLETVVERAEQGGRRQLENPTNLGGRVHYIARPGRRWRCLWFMQVVATG